MTYDLADHLKTIDGPSEPAVSFSIDALGRSKSRQVGSGSLETLNYAGTGDAIVRIGGGSAPVDAALDPAGTRLATRQGAGSPSFLVPDPHGNVAAIWSQGTSAWGDVFRYDPWGETIAQHSTDASRTPWRYQGRLVEGEPGDAELYDFGFRSYAADTGSFASLDDVAGGAHDVRSLNRFLYAHADPVTLIDPEGHKIEGPQSGQFEVGTTAQVIAKSEKAAKASAKTSSADAGHAKRPTIMVKADTWWAGPANWMSYDQWTQGGQLRYALAYGDAALDALRSGDYEDADAAVIFETADLIDQWRNPNRQTGLLRFDFFPLDRLDRIESAAAHSGDPWLALWGMGSLMGNGDGVKKGATAVREVKEFITSRLQKRVADLHGALDPRAQNHRTSAVMGTREGPDILAGGSRDLSKTQTTLASGDDIVARLPGQHAEITAMEAATRLGLNPSQMAVSRPILFFVLESDSRFRRGLSPDGLGAWWQ